MAQDTGVGMKLSEMNRQIVRATWQSPRRKGFAALVQQQTEQVLLTYLLAASIDEKSSFAAKAAMRKTLDDLKNYMEAQKKAVADDQLAGHYALALERMKAPEKAKPTIHAAIPPGAPIGCME
jgi:hypothetical protein